MHAFVKIPHFGGSWWWGLITKLKKSATNMFNCSISQEKIKEKLGECDNNGLGLDLTYKNSGTL